MGRGCEFGEGVRRWRRRKYGGGAGSEHDAGLGGGGLQGYGTERSIKRIEGVILG